MNHGGKRLGSGRPKLKDIKTPFRVTSREQQFIEMLRNIEEAEQEQLFNIMSIHFIDKMKDNL